MGEVAHVVTRKDKSRFDPGIPDVLLNVRLAVEMRNIDQPTLGLLLDMVNRGEDEIGNADFLGHVGHVLALGVLNVAIDSFPVIGDEKYSMGSR